MKIGVLALQGDFQKHHDMLVQLEVETQFVKYPDQLENCHGLIIPGGESTTLTKQMKYSGLYEPIIEFGQHNPIFGTCAGLIMLAAEVDDSRVNPLGLLEVSVHRNGWGRQVHSSTEYIKLNFDDAPLKATFIRAPSITANNGQVKVLAEFEPETAEEPVFSKPIRGDQC